MTRLSLLVIILLLSACQAAHRINPLLPKKIDAFMLRSTQGPIPLENLYSQHSATVLIFWQSTCPCVRRYQQRIHHLQQEFGERVLFVYIFSSSNESFRDAHAAFTERSTGLDLLQDEGGKLASALHIKGTPSAVIIDQEGQLRYEGWIDNERPESEKNRIAYLEHALNDVLNNRPVAITTSPMFGCPIR